MFQSTVSPSAAPLLICQHCFTLPGPLPRATHCQAKSCTFPFTKCKWECTVRAGGSTALLPRKLQWKLCSQPSAGRPSLTSRSCHRWRWREMDGDDRQCSLGAHVQCGGHRSPSPVHHFVRRSSWCSSTEAREETGYEHFDSPST